MPETHSTSLSPIGTTALEACEAIDNTFGKDVQIGSVIIVTEIITADGTDTIEFYSSDPRRWLQLALLQEATARADARNDERIEDAMMEEE